MQAKTIYKFESAETVKDDKGTAVCLEVNGVNELGAACIRVPFDKILDAITSPEANPTGELVPAQESGLNSSEQ